MFPKISKKPLWLILLGSAMTLCLAWAVFAAIYFGEPEGILELTHDAGHVRAGQVVKHEFPIVNKSRKPLQILDVKANCRCNLPKDIERTIEPRGSYMLPMSIDTEGHSGPESATALVRLDSGRKIRCALNCHVVTGYPKELVFGKIMKGEEVEKTFYLQTLGEQRVSIQEIRYPADYFDIEWHEHGMEDERISAHRMTVTVKPALPYGPFEHWITIVTDDSFEPKKRVNLRGYVRQPIECDKKRIAMGIIKGDSRGIAKIRISSPYDKPFEIVKVERARGHHCNWHLEKVDASNYELEIVIDGKEDETRTIISDEISIYGIAEKTRVRQDIHVFAMLGI
jgi:hypothetical protein